MLIFSVFNYILLLYFYNYIYRLLMRALFLFFLLIVFSTSSISAKDTADNDQYVLSLIRTANQNADKNSTKSVYYIEKALEYKDNISKTTLLKLYECAGKVFRTQTDYLLSLKYYNEQLELQKSIDPERIYYIYNDIGTIYILLEEPKKAREYFNKSLAGIKKSPDSVYRSQIYNVYNNLAILEQKEGNVIKALDIFMECKDICLKSNDIQGLIMAYQNISIANMELKDYSIALNYLHKAKYLAGKNNFNYDLGNITYNLGYAYSYIIVNPDSARYYFHKSFDLADFHQFPFIKKLNSEELSQFYEKEKNYEKANYYLHIAKDLSEENIKEQNTKKINQLEYGFHQKIREQELVNQQKKRTTIFIISSIVLVSIALIAFLMLRLQKSKLKARTAENELLAQKLEEKNKELTGKALQMMQTSEIIDVTQKELTELKENPHLATKRMITKIIQDLRFNTKGFNKDEFEKLFIETHSDFYKNLLQQFPSLTRNELRLCAFLKMNLSTKEISAITQQTHNSIVIARHRLRKKINLDKEKQSISSFLSKF